jgi:hypothetical protein
MVVTLSWSNKEMRRRDQITYMLLSVVAFRKRHSNEKIMFILRIIIGIGLLYYAYNYFINEKFNTITKALSPILLWHIFIKSISKK